jgi:5-methylthioadenosine/S-adenosylhomocysteine deaminase
MGHNLLKFNFPLVNAHTHAAMVAFRGLAEDVSLNTWLEKYIWPAEREKVNPDFVYKNTKMAIKEMRANGITTFLDMYFFEEEVARAAVEMKMRVVIGEVILDFPTPSAKNPQEALEKTEHLIKIYNNNPYVSVSVAPHSIYALSEKNLLRAKTLARKYNKLFQIHLAETKKEVADCLATHHLTPIGYLEKLGILDDKTILIHCVWLTDDDIKIIKERKAKVVHCPLSNLKLGSGIAPLVKLLQNKVTVALGTDGAASSNRLDIWEAGKFAILVQKGLHLDPTIISVRDVVKMMSTNGLKVLGFNDYDGRTVAEIEREIEENDFSHLYHSQAGIAQVF